MNVRTMKMKETSSIIKDDVRYKPIDSPLRCIDLFAGTGAFTYAFQDTKLYH